MATYRTFKQLNGKTLAVEDTIYFGKLKYTVYANFFRIVNRENNNTVFVNLGLTDEFQAEFLQEMYGYKPAEGGWLEYRTYDLEAATRAALGIYALLDKDPHIEFEGGKKGMRKVNLNVYLKNRVVKLTNDYFAHLNNTHVRVGCQKISYSSVKMVYDSAKAIGLIK